MDKDTGHKLKQNVAWKNLQNLENFYNLAINLTMDGWIQIPRSDTTKHLSPISLNTK